MVLRDSPSSSSATIQALVKFKRNPVALWRGYGALAGRNLPFTALQFPMFEWFKEVFGSWRDNGSGDGAESSLLKHAGVTALAAGSAGSIAAVITTPIDVVKTRIMLAASSTFANQDMKLKNTDAARKFKAGKVADAFGTVVQAARPYKKSNSSWAIGREIVREHGWKGLMRGGALRAAWTMIGSGLYLSVYEGGRLYLEQARLRSDED